MMLILLILMIGGIPWLDGSMASPMPGNDLDPKSPNDLSVLNFPGPKDSAENTWSGLLDEKENALMALILQALVNDNSSQPHETTTEKPHPRKTDRKLVQAAKSSELGPSQYEKFKGLFLPGTFDLNPKWENMFIRPFPFGKPNSGLTKPIPSESFPIFSKPRLPVASGSGDFFFKNDSHSHFKNKTHETVSAQCKGSCSISGGIERMRGTESSKSSEPSPKVYIFKNNTHYLFKNKTYEVMEAKCTGTGPCSISGGTGSSLGTGSTGTQGFPNFIKPAGMFPPFLPFPPSELFSSKNTSQFHFKNQTHEVSTAQCTGQGACSISGGTGSSSTASSNVSSNFPSAPKPAIPVWTNRSIITSGGLTVKNSTHYKNKTHDISFAECFGKCSISGGTGGSILGSPKVKPQITIQNTSKPTVQPSTTTSAPTTDPTTTTTTTTKTSSSSPSTAQASSELSTTVKPPKPVTPTKPDAAHRPTNGPNIESFFSPNNPKPSLMQESFLSAYQNFMNNLWKKYVQR